MKSTSPLTAEALRRRFPFESLAERLAPLTPPAARGRSAPPALGELARVQLEKLENSAPRGRDDLRARSLAMLHSEEVEKFINREGAGLSRRLPLEPAPFFLEYPEPPALAFASRPVASAGDPAELPIALPTLSVRDEPGGGWTPSTDWLATFHLGDQRSFADPRSFGYVKDRTQVAGFRSHGFHDLPELSHPDNRISADGRQTHPQRWRIGRLELVSLLKQQTPAVYLSEHLPRMAEMDRAKTRPLDPFEKQSLAKLVAGEEVTSQGTLNEIRMFGAVRAARQCLDCHGGQRGALLGAFSYRLFRDPPLYTTVPSG